MKTMYILLIIILVCISGIFGFLACKSPGKPDPFYDKSGNIPVNSISEKIFVQIGGISQGMFIKGRDINNPVLLFIHGGPSFPEYFLAEKYPSGLEDNFTVCYWEQRGGGLSYNRKIPLNSITLEQLTSDAIEVANYLRERFEREKIFLMAHSGGTAFAIQAAEKVPDLFYAYIAMAQVTRQAESEKMVYEYMMGKYKTAGNLKAVKKLGKYNIAVNDTMIRPFFKSVLRDECMHELGIGTMHNMKSIFRDVFLASWKCRSYTLKEKLNIWISKFSFINKSGIKEQVLEADIPSKVKKLDIPVYFLSGRYDYTVNYELARAYLDSLDAPVKEFHIFENSAHSPLFEEPLKVNEILTNNVQQQVRDFYKLK